MSEVLITRPPASCRKKGDRVSEHCGQLKFHLLSTSNCAIKASLAIVSKYRNLKMHSQHIFSVKILSSVRKNEVACQHIRFSFIHFYPKKCLALSADPIVIFHFLSTVAKQIEFSSFIFLKNYPDLSADSVFIFCFHQKLVLPSSPDATLSFNGISLLLVILFSNFLLIDLPCSRLKFQF